MLQKYFLCVVKFMVVLLVEMVQLEVVILVNGLGMIILLGSVWNVFVVYRFGECLLVVDWERSFWFVLIMFLMMIFWFLVMFVVLVLIVMFYWIVFVLFWYLLFLKFECFVNVQFLVQMNGLGFMLIDVVMLLKLQLMVVCLVIWVVIVVQNENFLDRLRGWLCKQVLLKLQMSCVLVVMQFLVLVLVVLSSGNWFGMFCRFVGRLMMNFVGVVGLFGRDQVFLSLVLVLFVMVFCVKVSELIFVLVVYGGVVVVDSGVSRVLISFRMSVVVVELW